MRHDPVAYLSGLHLALEPRAGAPIRIGARARCCWRKGSPKEDAMIEVAEVVFVVSLLGGLAALAVGIVLTWR